MSSVCPCSVASKLILQLVTPCLLFLLHCQFMPLSGGNAAIVPPKTSKLLKKRHGDCVCARAGKTGSLGVFCTPY